MKILLVHAHPEPASFTAALKDRAIVRLAAAGHEVRVSDLYAMGFDPVAKAADFGARQRPDHLVYALEQRHGWATGTIAADIRREVESLLWCETLILTFPVFWFSLPAILKGWIDRVFLSGVTYGGRRFYADGGLAGRRVWPVMCMGSREHMFGEAAVHGELEAMFRHLLRGTLHYVGLAVIEPFVAWHVPYIDRSARLERLARFEKLVDAIADLPALQPPSLAGFDPQMRPIG
jgi:NAD(P)H dehydrogenase (quinone)